MPFSFLGGKYGTLESIYIGNWGSLHIVFIGASSFVQERGAQHSHEGAVRSRREHMRGLLLKLGIGIQLNGARNFRTSFDSSW